MLATSTQSGGPVRIPSHSPLILHGLRHTECHNSQLWQGIRLSKAPSHRSPYTYTSNGLGQWLPTHRSIIFRPWLRTLLQVPFSTVLRETWDGPRRELLLVAVGELVPPGKSFGCVGVQGLPWGFGKIYSRLDILWMILIQYIIGIYCRIG